MPQAEVKKGKFIFLLLRLAFVMGGIIWGTIWFSQQQRWSTFLSIMRQMNIEIFAATLGIFTFCQLIVALRWWLLLRTQSIFINYWAAVRLHFLGLFYNNFMPSTVGGDLVRAWFVTKHTNKKFQAALSVFVDRVIGLLGTFIISILFYVLFLRDKLIIPSNSQSDGRFFNSLAVNKGIFFLILAAVFVITFALLLYKPSRELFKKTFFAICLYSIKMINNLKDAVVLYCAKPLTILVVLGLTILLQILTITGFWLVGYDMGVTVSVKYYYVFFPLSWALGAIPVSIGGAVVVEVSLASLFIKYAGVGEELAAALALCQRAVWMLASLPGAAIHLVGAHLPKDFFVDYDKSIN